MKTLLAVCLLPVACFAATYGAEWERLWKESDAYRREE